MQTKSKRSPKSKIGSTDINSLWLEWHVVKDSNSDEGVLSFDFSLVKREFAATEEQKVAIPVLALYHLAEKYNWLQVLRGPKHRPEDPYELVRFIQMLEMRDI